MIANTTIATLLARTQAGREHASFAPTATPKDRLWTLKGLSRFKPAP